MVGLGETMLDAMPAAGPVERMAAPYGGWTRSVLWQVGELDTVVREHGVDFVGDRLDQVVEESPGGSNRRALHQPSEGVLRGVVRSHEEVELALLSADCGNITLLLPMNGRSYSTAMDPFGAKPISRRVPPPQRRHHELRR
jgi:hypothetical protein